jgi:hypothetical protein
MSNRDFTCVVDGGDPCPNTCVRQGFCTWSSSRPVAGRREKAAGDAGEEPPPKRTATELALEEAKRHIDKLTRYSMVNVGWYRDAEAARAFISGVPEQAAGDAALPEPRRGDTPTPASIRAAALEEAAKVALKAGVQFMDTSPVSDPEGTLATAIQAIRALGEK